MNTLASLLSWTVSQLQGWPIASNIQTLEAEAFDEDRFYFKSRADLREPYRIQIRHYYNRGHLDYAYQLFTDQPVLRWDNKEDAGALATAPHHFHNANYDIEESPLVGNPARDWATVRAAIDTYLGDQGGSGTQRAGLRIWNSDTPVLARQSQDRIATAPGKRTL